MRAAGLVLIIGLAAGLPGCGSAPSEPVEGGAQYTAAAGDTVALRIGESVRVTGTDVTVQFTEVVSDSRCPIDAICVWEGEVHLQLRLMRGRFNAIVADLHTSLEPRDVAWHEVRIRLLHVEPSRVSDQPIRPGDYRARLEITAR